MNDYVIFAIFAAIVAVLMVICKLVYNTIAKAADKNKDRKDRASGAYRESEKQNLADRFIGSRNLEPADQDSLVG